MFKSCVLSKLNTVLVLVTLTMIALSLHNLAKAEDVKLPPYKATTVDKPIQDYVEKYGACDGRQWKDSAERRKCLFPDPPHGRWKAVYTMEFAKKYNLSLENISVDLSQGVDYMEMDVQPFGNGGTACLVNMLISA